MPPYARSNFSSTSESENEEAPEAISLSESKKESKTLEADRRNAEASQRRAKKEKNKELDRKFKERAEMNRNRGKERESARSVFERTRQSVYDGDEVLGKRMARVVPEAEDEDDSEDEEENNGDNDPNGFDRGGNEYGETDHDDISATKRSSPVKVNPDYLPDELFAAAFRSSASVDAKRKAKERDPLPTPPAKRRKSSKAKKDIVVGSRVIRVLPDTAAPTVPSTMPSRKIDRFLDRTLALKDSKQNLRKKGWERRPVNIGLLKRDGPAISFVRNS